MKKIFLVLFLASFALTGMSQKKQKNKFVVIETTMGIIKIEVFADVPQHAENFLNWLKMVFMIAFISSCDSKFYDSRWRPRKQKCTKWFHVRQW
jgi:hypothetical protein